MTQENLSPTVPVTAIVPVYNGERYIREALGSILGQTRRPAEIIVVDDGSTDRTAALVMAMNPDITLIRQANAGAAAARNAGIAAATGEYLAFLDHDDLWEPGKTELQLAAFCDDPQLDMVFGHAVQFPCPSLGEKELRNLKVPEQPMPAYLSGSRMVRRESLLRVGGYDPAIRMGECLDWHARAIDAGLKMRLLPDVVYRRRIHATNMGRTQTDHRGDYVLVMKRLLDRRRQRKDNRPA